MKFTKLIPFLILAIAFGFTSCGDDEDAAEPKPYVGEWHTAPFDFPPVKAKMNFDIKETSFVTDVLTLVGEAEVPTLGVKGDITPKTENILGFSLTDLGQPDGTGSYNWKNRVDNAAEFTVIYETYVSSFMPLDFDAEYEITDAGMDLIIPVANDTIVLFK